MENKQTMKEMFKGYSCYSDREYKNIWKDSIIVVDANILLDFYRYSEDTREKIFTILEKIKTRLWIPYQVGKEFFNNKDKVMVNSYSEYDELISIVNKKIGETKIEINKRKNSQLECKKNIIEILDKSISDISALLSNEKNDKKPNFEKNNIENRILELFNDSIGNKIIGEEYEKIKEEGKRRVKELIPPGYKDEKKEENGDYYIFYSLMEKAKESNKDIIFATNDVKEDWFNKIEGKIHGGRYELLNEFYNNTGKLLLIYTSDGFVEAYNKNLDKDFADESTISELKSIRNLRIKEEYNNFIYESFINKLNYHIKNSDNLSDREELINVLRLTIRELDIPPLERKRLFNELMMIRNYYYHTGEFKDERLREIINRIIKYYNYNSNFTYNENSDTFKEKYYNYLIKLKKCKTNASKIETYNMLIDTIKDQLKYLSDFPENMISDDLEKLLVNLLEDMHENNFTNKGQIIEQLESILKKYNDL